MLLESLPVLHFQFIPIQVEVDHFLINKKSCWTLCEISEKERNGEYNTSNLKHVHYNFVIEML